MRKRIVVVATAICVSICGLAYGNDLRLSPQSIVVGEVETFLEIRAENIRGSESTLIILRGKPGEFALEPSNDVNPEDPFVLMSWVPIPVAITEGTYTVEVHAKDVDQPVRIFGPSTFTVIPQPVIVQPPLIFVPEVVVATATSPAGANVSFTVNTLSQGGTGLTVTCTPASGSLFPLGATQVSCTAADSAGSASDQFVVFVADYGPPVMTVPAPIVSAVPNVNFTVTAVDAIDGDVPVVCSPSSGAAFPFGTTVVECVAVDSSQNPVYGWFPVTVLGGVPELQLPPDLTAEATSPAGAVVTYSVTATNEGVVTCSPSSGSTFPFGSTAVNCIAKNDVGSSSGMFVVTVADTRAPSLSLPADIVAEATSGAGAVVTYAATAVDEVDGVVVPVCSPAPGSTFPLGLTVVGCSATDAHGNQSTGSFRVTVRDTMPPQVISVTASPSSIWPPTRKMVLVQLKVAAVDVVSSNPVSTIVAVKSNQPENGLGDGDTAPDWNVVGPLTLELRAERAGSTDRVYTITVETSDESGNVSRDHVLVRVAQPPRAVR